MQYSYIYGNSETSNGKLLGRFWEKETGVTLLAPYGVLGIIKDACLVGTVMFTEYNGSNIELHIQGHKCLNRTTLRYLGNLIFNELNCNVLRVKPYSNDARIINIAKKIGFEQEAILSDYYKLNEHAALLKLTKEKAKRWINMDARTT